ncbi:FlhC family transcriptional regulator [Paraburkholderia unamae]|uniref:Transcriptional activator FlhC n=1 Tax=Paraburkholderia unamae TaxID=219649 RepID=A0ABX5KT76_9BURK|nr:FlhC family transcriptional regulator [Paraburkholderia unamae]PVX85818.1 transcriptional activator FlhC [Paraburkholderia unamae]
MEKNQKHKRNADDYKSIERLYLQPWLAERIRVANFDLVDHMKQVLISNPAFSVVYGVEMSQLAHLRRNDASLRSLLGVPFVMLSPALPTVEDWRCFVEDNVPTTRAVDELRRLLPTVRDPLTTQAIQHHNRQFLDVVQAVANLSVLAAPLLGVSAELTRYLGSLSAYQLRRALGRIRDLPLFQWRFRSPAFWFEFTSNDLTIEQVAHNIMRTTPFQAGKMDHTANWGDLRLGRDTTETYAAGMMAHGCRASTAASLFRLAPSRTRQMYMAIHDRRSPCGNLPNSQQWFVAKPQHRLHSTVFVWLYRAALNMGANTPQALIATADLYSKLFSGSELLTLDRGCYLTRWMAADNRLAIAPCRECGTHYIVSNNESKIEMRQNFSCPACTHSLAPRNRNRNQKQRHAED